MRRIFVRILFVLTAVILLAAVIVQVVLFTNIPRNIVLRSLEKQLHMRAETRSFSTGWLGNTTLHDVSFSVPLADQPILSVDTLNVRHTALIPLLFGRDLTIARLQFHHPTVRIVHGADGRWNVQQFASLFTSGSNGAQGGDSSPPPPLPAIDFVDGTVQVVDGTRQATMDQLNFKGEPQGMLSWKVQLFIADRLKLDGRLAPGGTWEHEATLSFNHVADWAQPWFKLPADLAAEARWHGSVSAAGIRGRLDASNIIAAGCTAAGAINIAQSDQGIDLRPDNLRVTTRLAAMQQITATSGSIRYDKNVIRAQALQLAAYGGPASITGYYDFSNQAGELTAGWNQLALPGKILHSGNLNCKIHRPFPTSLVVEGSLFSYASTPQGPWRATLNFGGEGEINSDFSWHVNAPELVWNRRSPIHLDGLEAIGSIHHPKDGAATVNLTALHLPERDSMNGAGAYSLADRSWILKISGSRFPVQLLQNALIGFNLDAAGNSAAIALNHFTLTQAQTTISVNGSYRFGIPKPVAATVALSSPPPVAAVAGQKSILEGAMRGDAQVEGTIAPLGLSLKGHLYGRAVQVAGRDIGDIALRVSGEVNPEHARLDSERLRALGGDWSFQTTYTFADELLDADVRVGGLPLENIAIATDTTPIHGTLAGEWDAYFLRFPLNVRNIRLRGKGWIHNLECAHLRADDAQFTTEMEDGALALDPINLKLGAAGQGAGFIKWNINRPHRLESAISLSAWPMQNGNASALVGLDVPAIAIDLPASATATTPLEIYADTINAQAALRFSNKPLGSFTLAAAINGQTASITDLHGTLLDAPASATAEIDFVHPTNSRASGSFEKLDTTRLAALFPQAAGLSGMLRGSALIGPATMRYPLEPLAFHVQTTFDQGQYRSLPVGVFNLNAFVNTDRIVLDDRPGHESTLAIAGGDVRLWGRFARPEPNVFSSQAELQLHDIDLNGIAHCVNPRIKPTPGRLGGNIMLLYNSRAAPPPSQSPASARFAGPAMRKFMQTVYGEAKLGLTGSDMVTVPIFSDLYNISSLGQAGAGPIGHGALEARLEGGTLFIFNVHYFNRGTDALVQLTSPNMWDFPHNNVDGNAVGSLRPFAALKLPLVSDVQTALDALQGNFTSIHISGTWDNMRRTQVAFSNLGKEIRDLLLGNINNTSQQERDQTPQP